MEYITAFKKICNLSESNNQKLKENKNSDNEPETILETSNEIESTANAGLVKALETYRKLMEAKRELTEKEQKELEKKPIIETDSSHEPTEIPVERGKIAIGPPTLTRFEKARITGARALQLSLGAPPFIPIPETAKTSLDIAIKELEERVIPIAIKRVLPNGDYQNIPIDYFK